MGGQRWIGGRVSIAAGGDDALRGFDLRAPLVGAFALAQQGQGEHVRPGLVEQGADEFGQDRKSTRRTPVTNAHLVCRLLLEKKKAAGTSVDTLMLIGIAHV